MSIKISGLYVYKNVASLGYPVLESFISSFDATDEQIVCVDPTSDSETIKLAHALDEKFPSVRLHWFKWPEKSLDGSAIGIASQYAMGQATGTHVLNVQADEAWHPNLVAWAKTEMREWLIRGIECIRFKVLHTEFNASQFQGGEQWDGKRTDENGRYTDVWHRGGLFNGKVGGAGYNASFKLAKRCPSIKFSHDAWSFDGCAILGNSPVSEDWPIVHLHDMMRDHYIALRKNAGDNLWTDPVKFGAYKADADRIEETKDLWYNNPAWTRTTSPFEYLLPDCAKHLLGKTRYTVDYSLLDQY